MTVGGARQRLAVWLAAGFLTASAGAAQTVLTDANGQWTITTAGNRIDIDFRPDANRVNCSSIGLVQTVQLTFLDAAGQAMTFSPGDLYDGWAYRDDDALSDGTVVDHLFCEQDAAYNGSDPQDTNTTGSAAGDGSAVTDSTMDDSPLCPDRFYPAGKVTARWSFETCAVCLSGVDAGTVYGCVRWSYRRRRGDAGSGTATLSSTAIERPSSAHTTALANFRAFHRTTAGTQCPEDLPAGNCGNRVYNREGPLVFHVNDNYTIRSSGPGVRKGRSSPDHRRPSNPVGGSLVACDYVLVPDGEKICIRRSSDLEGPDPRIPFRATFVDLYVGGIETVSTGTCAGPEQCGVRVNTLDNGLTLAAAAPVDSSDPETIVLYTAAVDTERKQVIFENDALSSGVLQVVDVLGAVESPAEQGTLFYLEPGERIVFSYPEVIRPLPPE